MIVLIPVSFFAAKPEPATAATNDIVSCEPRGSNIVCSVLGEGVILTVPIPTIKVPGPTIKVPGPTVEVPVPGPTRTVEVPVPGPTRTVEIPGPTETVTVRPDNPQPSQAPAETETVTVQPEPTGQPSPTRGTVAPSPEPEVVTETETRTKTETIVRQVLLGTLASIAFAALGILALFLGYLLGQRDAKKNEDKFLESLLDSVRLSKRPTK